MFLAQSSLANGGAEEVNRWVVRVSNYSKRQGVSQAGFSFGIDSGNLPKAFCNANNLLTLIGRQTTLAAAVRSNPAVMAARAMVDH
jgi:hypothetical protein